MNNLTIAYIGGGSRLWARHLMSDLAVEDQIGGTVKLYDIDIEAAKNNAKLGNLMMAVPEAKGHFKFEVSQTLDSCLEGADFILISILPATFDEMDIYVHGPEEWNVYQPVGDTAGPAGIFRSLIMMPMYHTIAKAIKRVAPQAWVINFTNPMTMCVQMLYHTFPEIKAYGNCHEVFHVQEILAKALGEETGIHAKRSEIKINPQGINHFTWINQAHYHAIDLMPIYEKFAKKYQQTGLNKETHNKNAPFSSAERVKFDLYLKHHVIAAAGDRHLVEFLPQQMYVKDPEMVRAWDFYLTSVEKRKEIKRDGTQKALDMIEKKTPVKLTPSNEEGVLQMKALLGLGELITNINTINHGQIENLPLGHVVETNALFRKDLVQPIFSGKMPDVPHALTLPHIYIHELLIKAFDHRDLSYAKEALLRDPYTEHLSPKDKLAMFDKITSQLSAYLSYYTHH
ncbi:MAG: alpha-glucosidase/alpha-galactosidase [Acholeplasmataceae bacterium]